jgi:hypothetical protein
MRARVAYISSLGTTAILVAAALLMLALVGALVAFRGWPGGANGAVVQQVPLGPGTGAARTVLVRPVAATKRVVRVRSFTARAASRARVSTAGLVKDPAPPAVSGVVMAPVSTVTMQPTAPQTRGGEPAATVQQAVQAPQPPATGDPTTVGGPPGNPLAGLPLLDPNAPASSPQTPSSDQVATMVGELIGSAPPPPGVGSLVDNLRR